MIRYQFAIGGLCKTCARCKPAGRVYVFDCPVRNTIECHFYEPKVKDELTPSLCSTAQESSRRRDNGRKSGYE